MKGSLILAAVLGSVASSFSLDREAFTFTNYDLNVQVEPEQQRLAVRGTVTLRNDSSGPQKNAVLQISSGLAWHSIQLEGKPVQFVRQPYVSDVDHTGELSEAIVTLPKGVPPGGSVEMTVGYEGVIALDATRLARIGLPQTAATHSDWDQIGKTFTAVRGVGYVTWYPVAMEVGNLSEGNSLFEVLGRWKTKEKNARMRLRLEYSSLLDDTNPPVILCIGKIIPGAARGESSSSHSADCSYDPVGLSVPGFVAAEYESLDRPNLEVAHRAEDKTKAERFGQAADAAAPFVKEWFGVGRQKAQVVELFDEGASPFETGAMLLTPLNDADPNVLEIALVHELVHAAFPSPRPWIFEGVAHFAQAAYRGQRENRAAALVLLELHRPAILEAEKALAMRPKDARAVDESLMATAIDEFYRSKAAYVWWMLRDMLGEETVKKALAAYQPDQDQDPAYLQHLLEAQSKRDLQWFFDDWVYHDRGLPDFRVESAYPRLASQGNYLVTVTIENLGNAGAEVPVTVRFDGGELTQRVEVHGKAKGVVRVTAPKLPTEIIVNDGSVPESDLANNILKVQSGARLAAPGRGEGIREPVKCGRKSPPSAYSRQCFLRTLSHRVRFSDGVSGGAIWPTSSFSARPARSPVPSISSTPLSTETPRKASRFWLIVDCFRARKNGGNATGRNCRSLLERLMRSFSPMPTLTIVVGSRAW